MIMDDNKKLNFLNEDCLELIEEIKKELPNIVLPSMGLIDDVECIDIDGKNFIINNEEV